jgi:hypothetical protein
MAANLNGIRKALDNKAHPMPGELCAAIGISVIRGSFDTSQIVQWFPQKKRLPGWGSLHALQRAALVAHHHFLHGRVVISVENHQVINTVGYLTDIKAQ